MIKVSFAVPPEVYAVIQASAARAGDPLPVFVRDIVYKACEVDASSLASMPAVAPRLTVTKRDLLTLLQNHRASNEGAPYLTTQQISGALSQADMTIYLNLRALLRDGLIERGQNVQRSGQPGAPCKAYAITEMGTRTLTDDTTRVARAHADFQARSREAYAAVGNATGEVKRPDDAAFKPNVHSALRYIAMAQLGRAIESETDVETMKASHARLCQAADSDVTSGAHTYGQILEKLTAKIQSLGGFDAISERFNIG